MQLSSIDLQDNHKEALLLVVESKALCLEDEILSKISTLPESEQARLLALAAPKLEDEKLKQAFDMLLGLEDSLSKGLALIDYLPYLVELKAKTTLGEAILKSINKVNKTEKIELIEKLIEQLELQKKTTVGWSAYLTNLWQDLVLIVKNSCEFEVKDKISLIGRLFDLGKDNHKLNVMKDYYLDLLTSINSTKNSSEKYLLLLVMLKDFPLEGDEISELAYLALEFLRESNAQSIRVKDKVSLLEFFPKREENRIFATELYESVMTEKQSCVEYLENLSNFASYYSLIDKIEFYANEDRLDFYAAHELQCIVGHFCDCEGLEDCQYFEVVEFLMGETFFNSSIKDALMIIENIKSPVTKVDAIILVLSKLSNLYRLQKKLRKDVLNTVSLVKDVWERIALTMKIVQYLGKKTQQAVAATLIENIDLLDEVQKAEVLVDLTAYLSSRVRKQAFQIANNIKDEFNRNWACIAFASYLTKGRKQQVIQDVLELIDKPDDLISVAQKALIIKQLIKFGLTD